MQSHLLESHVAVVAPMILQDGRSAFTLTSVAVAFAGEPYIVLAGELTSIESKWLQRSIGDLLAYEDELRRALDRLFTGF